MIAEFWHSSNVWLSYLSNFFFAAAGFAAVARFVYKIIIKHNDDKIDSVKFDIDKKFNEMDLRFTEVLSQYKPNGGSSSKDQWNKIERIAEDLVDGQRTLHDQIDTIKQDFAEHKGFHKGINRRDG